MYGDAGQAERRILEKSHGGRWCAGTGRHRRFGPVVNGRAGVPQGTFPYYLVPGTDAREEPEGSNSIRFRLGDDVEAANLHDLLLVDDQAVGGPQDRLVY